RRVGGGWLGKLGCQPNEAKRILLNYHNYAACFVLQDNRPSGAIGGFIRVVAALSVLPQSRFRSVWERLRVARFPASRSGRALGLVDRGATARRPHSGSGNA